MTILKDMTYAYIACWALIAGAVHAAEKPDAHAAQAPDGKRWSVPALEPDPTLRAAIEKALEQCAHHGQLFRDTKDRTLIVTSLQIDKPPTDMAFDVSLRSGARTWRVGPMAWKKGDMMGWAYNVDLPETLTQVDIIFTPSARAGMLINRFPTHPLRPLLSIWSGEPIVVTKVEIRKEDISMITLRRPPGIEESREHLIDALPPDSDQTRQLADGITLSEMRQHLDEQAATPNPAPEVLYALGCVLSAQGQLDEAMATLVKARGVAGLEERLQHELRYICARWLDAAANGRMPEMFSLGSAYEEGKGVGQDVQQAKYWYRKAANAGNAEATARLAAMKPPAPSAVDPAAKALAEYRAQAAKWHEKSTTTYQEWVDRHTHKDFRTADIYGKPAYVKMILTRVEDEADGKPAQAMRLSETRDEFELLTNGQSKDFRHSAHGSRGGGSDARLPAETLARIDRLLARLPDDDGLLPPANRRLLIEATTLPERRVRVYDLADAPPGIYELMRLVKFGTAYVPRFQAYSSIDVRGLQNQGVLAVSPHNEILFSGRRRRLQWWDPATHEFLAEADVEDVRNIVFAPDKVQALVQTSSDTVLIDLRARKPVRTFKDRFGAQFTQDGKHALLFAHQAPMQILDTQTWEPVDHADDVPGDCTRFIPAPTTHRALVRAADGSVTLWDTGGHQPVKQLSSKSEVTMFAAFSPDESQLALCAHPYLHDDADGTPIAIFKSDTGAKVNGLWPFETGGNRESIQSLLWAPDGAYVLAATGSGAGASGVSVFNAATGRNRGELTGPTRINGMGLLTRSGELVVGDEHGKIWFWNLSAVMANVREFEDSLTPATKR